MLLPALHYAQSLYGWLPTEAQDAISRALRVPLADVHGVIEFYTMFYSEPMAKTVVRVCEDSACRMHGGDKLAHAIEQKLAIRHGESTPDMGIAFEVVPCLGMCEQAPCALVGEKPAGDLTPNDIPALLAQTHPEPAAKPHGDMRHILKRIGKVDPASIDDYLAHDGYQALPQALRLSPAELIAEVESLGILGRGGAMFPLGRKWRFTRGAPGSPREKHIVVNADESEPGTFKDRGIMEEDPFALIEGMTIAAYGVGAENGWIFIRGEYPRAFHRLQAAIDAAREAGYLGRDIQGRSGFNFDIEVRLSAGAYICGEETAMFEAIEGKRGFPRIKPPYPTTHGLFMQPTAANNVETLVAMVAALNMGGDAWRAHGVPGSPGTKLMCVSGNIAKPGVYEIPFGVTVRELIDMAGGVPDDKGIQAILMGGAAGKFIDDSRLDLPLDYDSMRAADVPMGSGVVMVFDEEADLRQPMYELSRFFAHESCGKCFPCQLGTQRQMEILDRVQHGDARPDDRQILLDVGFTMTETSLCGLGQTAASAVVSAIDLWPELVE